MNPWVIARDLTETLELTNISVHESTIYKSWCMVVLSMVSVTGHPWESFVHGEEKNMCTWNLPKSNLTLHNNTGKNVLRIDGTKVELFGKNMQDYIWCKKGTAYQHKNIIPAAKCSRGGYTIWCYFAAYVPVQPVITKGQMNSQVYHGVLWDIMIMSGRLSASWSSVEVVWCSRKLNLNIQVNC